MKLDSLTKGTSVYGYESPQQILKFIFMFVCVRHNNKVCWMLKKGWSFFSVNKTENSCCSSEICMLKWARNSHKHAKTEKNMENLQVLRLFFLILLLWIFTCSLSKNKAYLLQLSLLHVVHFNSVRVYTIGNHGNYPSLPSLVILTIRRESGTPQLSTAANQKSPQVFPHIPTDVMHARFAWDCW